MTLSQATEQSQPEQSQKDVAPLLQSEGPKDNKNKIIARLKNIGNIVSTVSAEQSKGNEQHPFNVRASELVKLGDGYTKYLETHADEIPDEGTFQSIATLAKASFFMNIKQYVQSIRSIGGFVDTHPELNNLNPIGEVDGPWAKITEALYYSSNNDIREQFREGIISRAGELIQSNDLNIRDFDHLERFLVDPQGRLPKEFIPEYVTTHVGEIKQWAPLKMEAFQEHVMEKIGSYDGSLSQNEYLQKLDEEIASIQTEDLKKPNIQFPDRQAKLAFIRDLRFGRINPDTMKAEIAKRMEEITRRPDLKTLGQYLKGSFSPFLATLRSTIGVSVEERKPILTALVESYGLEENAKKAVLEYLDVNLK